MPTEPTGFQHGNLFRRLKAIIPHKAPIEERPKLPRVKYPHYKTGDAQDWTYEYTWEDFQAFEAGKNPLFHETPPELIDEVYHKLFPDLIRHPEKLQKGGTYKGSDIGSIETMLKMHYCCPNPPHTLDLDTLRNHWSDAATATASSSEGLEAETVEDDELLPGELSAVIFRLGCYMVRFSDRVYKGFSDTLADPQEVQKFKDAQSTDEPWKDEVWVDDLQRVQEISARHIDQPDAPFIFVCKTKNSRGYRFCESIEAIYTVKENSSVPDEYASLFVRIDYSGTDYSADNWYQLTPTGRVASLRYNGYGQRDKDARFV